jgi:hypothetical protein
LPAPAVRIHVVRCDARHPTDEEDGAPAFARHDGAGATEGGPGCPIVPETEALHPADFTIREDGVVRLNPELARRVAKVASCAPDLLANQGQVRGHAMNNVVPSKADVIKLTAGIATAFAGFFFPPAVLIAPLTDLAVEKFVKRPEKILCEELARNNVTYLTEEMATAFVPMAYKYFEAAKEGEYEHNLKLLAELLRNEIAEETPDASSFSRMTRRVEGLTKTDLNVIALINSSLSTITQASTEAPSQTERPYVSAIRLARDPNNKSGIDHFTLQERLSDLAGRGLLIADGSTRFDKGEEYYFASSSFMELIQKAKNSIHEGK